MTGFNVNCKDCDNCYFIRLDWNDEDKPKEMFRCVVYCAAVDTINNIDCLYYEPKRADN